jgi:hypothetical protein
VLQMTVDLNPCPPLTLVTSRSYLTSLPPFVSNRDWNSLCHGRLIWIPNWNDYWSLVSNKHTGNSSCDFVCGQHRVTGFSVKGQVGHKLSIISTSGCPENWKQPQTITAIDGLLYSLPYCWQSKLLIFGLNTSLLPCSPIGWMSDVTI